MELISLAGFAVLAFKLGLFALIVIGWRMAERDAARAAEHSTATEHSTAPDPEQPPAVAPPARAAQARETEPA